MKRRKKKLLIFFIIIVIIIISTFIYLFQYQFKPLVISFAEARVRSITTKAINDAIIEAISNVNYTDLIHVQYDNDGRIAMLQGNATEMNIISSSTALAAQQRISDLGEQGMSIPIGTIAGGALLSGRGPKLHVTITPVGSVVSSFVSDFESTGINQSLHRIKLRMDATVRIVIAGSSGSTINVTSEMPVTESVIVGDVPQNYVQVPDIGSMLNLIP